MRKGYCTSAGALSQIVIAADGTVVWIACDAEGVGGGDDPIYDKCGPGRRSIWAAPRGYDLSQRAQLGPLRELARGSSIAGQISAAQRERPTYLMDTAPAAPVSRPLSAPQLPFRRRTTTGRPWGVEVGSRVEPRQPRRQDTGEVETGRPPLRNELGVLLPWRRSLVAWSAMIALGLGAVTALLIVVPDGSIGWRVVAAFVLIAVAIDSADFVVMAMSGPAVRVDPEGIEFFGMGVVPWSAIRSSSLIEEEGGATRLVVVSNDSDRWMQRRWWVRPRSRRYVKRGEVSVSMNLLQDSRAQVVEAFERCGRHLLR